MPTRFVGSLLRSLLLSVLGCLSAAPAIAQTNLLTNPGFETGQAAPWDNGGGAQLTAAAAHSGNYGVRMTTSQFLTQGWIAVTPGQTYVVTGWFKWNAFAGTDWGYDFLDVLGNDFQAETVASQLHTRYPQNTWVKLALTFVARTTAVQVRFGVYGPQTTIDLAFDDLLIARKLTNTGPTVAPTATPTSGVAPLAVQFAANANDTDGAVGVVQWDFGDGSTSPLDGTSHTYTTRGTYQARITAWDDNGASATQTVSIQVTADGNPTITIAQPTTQDTLATAAATATLSGTAVAPAGRTIQSVMWDNVTSRTAGIVAVTPAASINWNAGAVGLKPGKNDILVTTVDSTGAASTDRIVVTRTVTGPVVSNVTLSAANARQFEKVELNFDLATVADFPMYRYDTAPPPGVVPGTGVTVEGVFVTPSGQTLRQPGFIYGAVTTSTVAGNLRYEETGPVSWKVRFSPLETGTYSVTLHVQDASGTTDVAAGQFTAAAASRRGFVRVSDSDSRYFEFTNRDLFFPIGPANGPAYSSYTTPGLNFERPWMAGEGAYSGNWSRWLRIDMAHGNEGTDPPLSLVEHFPSHELSYELYAGAGHRIWMGAWGDQSYGPVIRSGRQYQILLRLRTVGMTGPVDGALPYGFMIKTHGFPDAAIETDLRARPSIVTPITRDREWHTVVTRFTATSQDAGGYLSLLLDNVSGGRVFIDEFSIREVLAGNVLGGEVIRQARADIHTYVEQRPAAYFDDQVRQGEINGVFFKYVVQDKRDWIQARLTRFGVFASVGDGYFQQNGTRAKWLQEQWWRYLVARWGYSTAVHSWELCNEADPNDTNVWRHTQEFARFLHQIDAHPHLATTSFWCCWKPEFWGNDTAYPDVDYADLHEYTNDTDMGLDMVEWLLSLTTLTSQSPVNKPVILAETGIGIGGQTYYEALKTPNPGVWYHNLLWAQLNGLSGMTAPNYWFSEHFAYIDRNQIAQPFYQFVAGLGLNKGGYVDAAGTSTNAQIRVLGQKNLARNDGYLWIQNKLHNWHNVMGVFNPVAVTAQSGTVTVRLSPSTTFTVERWNTSSGALVSSTPVASNAAGDLALPVSNLTDDFAVKIIGPSAGAPGAPATLRVR